MLHARLEVAQILDMFQVRCVIHEFCPGTDPVVWDSGNRTIVLDEIDEHEDALSTVIRLVSLWSEMTISE